MEIFRPDVKKDEHAGAAEQKLRLLLDKLHGEEHGIYDKLIEFLSERCEVTVLKKKPLDLKLLTEHDVFMLIFPNKSWEKSEIETVRRYVESHGGILVVTTSYLRKPKHLNKLLEPYGLSVNDTMIDEKYLAKNSLEASPLLAGVDSLALSSWGAMSTKVAASNEAEVMLQYKDAILGAKRSLGKGAAYLFCLSAFGDKQLDQVDNRIFLDNLLKSLSTPAMTATLQAIAKDEALTAQATAMDEALAAQEIVGFIVTGHSEDLFFTSDRVIVAKKGSVAKFFGWGLLGRMADAAYKGYKAVKLSELPPDKVLRANKHNFAISYDEISKIEIRKTFPVGAWTITVETSTDKHAFDWALGLGRDVRKHTSFLVPLLSDKLSIRD